MQFNRLRQPTFLLLTISFLVFLIAQVYMTAGPMLSRAAPVEVDDAYSYLIKAEEMRQCSFKTCPALTDLHAQFTAPTTNSDVAYTQIREYHRLFVVYQPLQSLGLVLLSSLGLNYHIAYAAMAITFKVILCTAIALWLRAILGDIGAAAGLLLLAPIVFIGAGIHTIVPGTMALAVSLLLWGFILNGESRPTVLLPVMIAPILLHEIGKIYVGMGLLALLFLSLRPYARNVRTSAIGGFLLVGIALLATFAIQQPELRFDPTEFYPGEWNYLGELANSLSSSIGIVNVWLASFGYSIITIFLLIVGLLSIPAEKRLKWVTMFVLLLGLLVFGAFYVVPWFGAFTFERAWVPMGILLTATIAAGALKSLSTLWGSIIKQEEPPTLWFLLWTVSLGLFAFTFTTTYIPFYTRHFELTYENQERRQNLSFDESQPRLVFDRTAEQRVLYREEIAFYYYIVNGGLAHRAIYYPVAKELDQFENDISDADFVVAQNPVFSLSEDPNLGIVLDDFASLQIMRLDGIPIGQVQLTLEMKGGPVPFTLKWMGGAASDRQEIMVEAGSLLLISPDASAVALLIHLRSGSQIRITGIKFVTGTTTNWPWQQGVRLELTTNHGTVTSVDISNDMLGEGLPFDVKVVDDDGYTVLAEVTK